MRSRIFHAFAVTALLFAAIAACKTAELAAQGGECSLATDCQPGLVCIGKPDGTRTCESDLSGVTNPVPANARDGGEGGPVVDDDAATTPDTSTPGQDATTTPDTSTPTPDAAPDTSTADAADAAG